MSTTASICPAAGHGCSCDFDMELIRRGKPYPEWLQGEMQSNHAGETGAVGIYDGALWALDVRARFGSHSKKEDEQRLRDFCLDHRSSEKHHLDLLEEIIEPSECSKLLPGWKVAGWALGAASTIFNTRRMFLTTAAVEAFVESHYNYQISRLGSDPLHVSHEPSLELRRMLEHCCEDEVHHKEEAAARAGATLSTADKTWQWLVGAGSAVAANAAKRL